MRRPNDALPGEAPPVAEAIAPDANSSTQSSGTDRQRRERWVEAGHPRWSSSPTRRSANV